MPTTEDRATEIRTFVEKYVSFWQAANLDALVDCYAEDAQIDSPMFRTVKGRDEIEGTFQDIFRIFTDFVNRIDEIVVDSEGDRAVLVVTTRATHRGEIFGFPGSGRRVENKAAYVFHFEKDRIKSETRLYDFTGLLVQLGVLRAKGG